MARLFHAPNIIKAMEIAPQKIGLVAEQSDIESLTIEQAFKTTLQKSNIKEGTTSWTGWVYVVKRFFDWLLKEYPDIRYWHQFTRKIIDDYSDTIKNKSKNTHRIYMQPIRQTSKKMNELFDCKDIASHLKFSNEIMREPSSVLLYDVLEIADYFKEVAPRYEIGICLGGLVGMRFSEILNMKWCDVDLEKKLINIPNGKNKYSIRLIPYVERVQEAFLRAWQIALENNKNLIKEKTNIITNHRHKVYNNFSSYRKKILRLVKEWNPDYKMIVGDLRNCILQFARNKGIRNETWESYVGHRGGKNDISARHYINRLTIATIHQEKELNANMDIIREQVVYPLEAEIKDYYEARILKNFEQTENDTINEAKVYVI